MNDNHQPNRPTLGAEGAEAHEAIHAVAHLVEELQAGWDQHDADLSNQHFAADVMGAARSVQPSITTRCSTLSMFA